MSLAAFNASTSGITTTGNFCTIIATDVSQLANAYVSGAQGRAIVIDNASYYIAIGSSWTGALNFQELGADGTWRSLSSPAQITTQATSVNGTIAGQFRGLRINIATFSGGTITYAELKGAIYRM